MDKKIFEDKKKKKKSWCNFNDRSTRGLIEGFLTSKSLVKLLGIYCKHRGLKLELERVTPVFSFGLSEAVSRAASSYEIRKFVHREVGVGGFREAEIRANEYQENENREKRKEKRKQQEISIAQLC